MDIKLSSVRNLKTSESLLRITADFALVHVSMLAAMIVVIGTELAFGSPGLGKIVMRHLFKYYATQFAPLSLVFPVTFLVHGFYTQSRLYASRYKILFTLQGVVVGLLFFLAANFLVFRADLLPRRVALVFAAFALIAIPFARMAKWLFLRHFHVAPRAAISAPAEAGANRVLVVGGAGYIGSILVRRLLEMGKNVRVLDNLVYGDDAIRGVLNHPRFELMIGDCRNIQNVVSAVRGVNTIIHLAAIVGDPACEQDRRSALEINYAATRMMIEIAKGNGIRQFIFASSCSVYGATEYLADEKAQVNPISLYAQTKVDSENALLEAGSDSFHPIILRFATVFGHSWRPRFDLVVNLLTAKASQESLITIYNGQQWRPFIHVRDISEAIIKVMNAPLAVTAGQIYNVGDSRLNHTLTQVAEKIQKHFPDTRIEHVENSDKRNYRVSFEKVRKEIDFQCSIDLDEGISEMHEAFLSGAVLDYKDIRFHNQRFLQRSGVTEPPRTVDREVMAAFAQREVMARATAS